MSLSATGVYPLVNLHAGQMSDPMRDNFSRKVSANGYALADIGPDYSPDPGRNSPLLGDGEDDLH
jgi:hypothetical protein